jgi:serine/threonine-protein kinase
MDGSQDRVICPSCRTPFEEDSNFCARCGADMRSRAKTVPVPTIPDSVVAAAADPLVGRLIDTRYRVMARVGSGGMGIVYKVEHQRMGKIAAMKVLHRDLAGDPEVVKRFRREAEAVSKLNHPSTVQTFDFGAFDGGLYLVMEYVRGEDLGAILRRDGPLPFARAAQIFLQVCGALAEAHELGIVHRDLKPENLLVTRGKDGHDHAKVLDFGLAKLSERPDSSEITNRDVIIGTPYYMSPEQIRGEELDRRSDIYSLGALMYKVLTGEPPFSAQTPVGVLTKHLTEDAVVPSERRPDMRIDERVDAIVLRAMAKRIELRYSTVDALQADLVWVRALVVPFVLIGGAVGVWYYLHTRKASPQNAEVEPNNDRETATLIASGQTVRGKIGQRLGPNAGDVDFFQIHTHGSVGARVKLAVKLSAIPNIDLALTVVDHEGHLLATADARGVGEPEVIPNLGVQDDVAYVRVAESALTPIRVPTENLSDEYELVATVSPPVAGEELEPNDVDSDATPIAADAPVRGWLGASDVDCFRFGGAPGSYEIEVAGAEAAQVRLRVGDGERHLGRKLRATLKTDDVIRVERVDEAPGPTRPLFKGTDQPYTIVVRAAK